MNEKIVRALRDKPAKIAVELGAGYDLLSDIHNDWIRMMMFSRDDFTLIGHRKSYKTTCLSVAISNNLLLKPWETQFFIRKTDDDVIDIVNRVRKILESDLYQYLAKEIYGTDLILTTSSAYKIDTNLNTGLSGQAQLQGMGINGSITGKHAMRLFCDDISTIKDRYSRAEREQTIRQYQELQNIRNQGGVIINTLTPWHKDDVVSATKEDGTPKYMPNQHRYTVYDTGIIPPEEIQELRESMSPSLFAANYELKHIADGEAMFEQAQYLDDTEENRQLIYNGIAQCDAAYNGTDYTAYTIFKELDDGRIIGYGNMWRKHVNDCVGMIKSLHDFYRAGSLNMETNADKGFGGDKFETAGFIVNDYHESMNKFIKISTYLKSNWKRIYWLADTDKDYITQILDYTEHAEHDDAPDSAASLLRQMDDSQHTSLNTSPLLKRGLI